MKYVFLSRWSDTFGNPGTYFCEFDGVEFFVKLAPYANLEYDQRGAPPTGFMLPPDAEINILRAIKTRIIDTGLTPHLIEILAAFICHDVAKLITNKAQCERRIEGKEPVDDKPPSILCIVNEMIARGQAPDKIALMFTEICNLPLRAYMAHHLPIHKLERDVLIMSIAFQIYYTLLVLTRVWPQFSHGDLRNPANVMIKIMESPSRKSFLRYVVDDRAFDIPYIGIIVKLIDFGHSKIPEEGIISAVEQNRPERAAEAMPDYIEFIYTLEREFTNTGMPSILLKEFFSTLNPHEIKSEMGLRAQLEFARKTPSLEKSLMGSAFALFRAESGNDPFILQTFHTPK